MLPVVFLDGDTTVPMQNIFVVVVRYLWSVFVASATAANRPLLESPEATLSARRPCRQPPRHLVVHSLIHIGAALVPWSMSLPLQNSVSPRCVLPTGHGLCM